jgi:hypothetical protein
MLDAFRVSAPWGVVRIEFTGTGGDIPEIDPVVSPVEANDTCVVAGVVHGDIDEVEISVGHEGDSLDGIRVYEGLLSCPNGEVEVADLVGEDFCRTFSVQPGVVRLEVAMDDPEEAQKLFLRFTQG